MLSNLANQKSFEVLIKQYNKKVATKASNLELKEDDLKLLQEVVSVLSTDAKLPASTFDLFGLSIPLDLDLSLMPSFSHALFLPDKMLLKWPSDLLLPVLGLLRLVVLRPEAGEYYINTKNPSVVKL